MLLRWLVEIRVATDAALLAALGENEVATLRARGAGLDFAEAITYLRAEAERAFAVP
jgi:hypothetical protein